MPSFEFTDPFSAYSRGYQAGAPGAMAPMQLVQFIMQTRQQAQAQQRENDYRNAVMLASGKTPEQMKAEQTVQGYQDQQDYRGAVSQKYGSPGAFEAANAELPLREFGLKQGAMTEEVEGKKGLLDFMTGLLAPNSGVLPEEARTALQGVLQGAQNSQTTGGVDIGLEAAEQAIETVQRIPQVEAEKKSRALAQKNALQEVTKDSAVYKYASSQVERTVNRIDTLENALRAKERQIAEAKVSEDPAEQLMMGAISPEMLANLHKQRDDLYLSIYGDPINKKPGLYDQLDTEMAGLSGTQEWVSKFIEDSGREPTMVEFGQMKGRGRAPKPKPADAVAGDSVFGPEVPVGDAILTSPGPKTVTEEPKVKVRRAGGLTRMTSPNTYIVETGQGRDKKKAKVNANRLKTQTGVEQETIRILMELGLTSATPATKLQIAQKLLEISMQTYPNPAPPKSGPPAYVPRSGNKILE